MASSFIASKAQQSRHYKNHLVMGLLRRFSPRCNGLLPLNNRRHNAP